MNPKRLAFLYIALFLALSPLNEAWALSVNRTCKVFAKKTSKYQMDGYKHLEYVDILRAYCENLMEEFKAGNDSYCRVRAVHKAVRALSKADLEGKNPLYLPQAKIFKQCFSCGPTVLLAEAISDPKDMTIQLRIFRKDKEVSFGETSFRNMIRPLEVLIEYLGRENEFPAGVILSTGTGIVPEDDFTLSAGDRVEITVDPIGTLVNTVTEGNE